MVLAKQIATLDYLSRGRCLPAVGLGQEDPTEYEACGVPKSDRGQRTDEAILLMRRVLLHAVPDETAGFTLDPRLARMQIRQTDRRRTRP